MLIPGWPCNSKGNNLPDNTPPPPCAKHKDFSPFADHLILWVEQYIYLTAENKAATERIFDDIDQRYTHM